MSFNNEARKARDASLPYGRRVSALRSCVQLYSPIGFCASLSYLELVAGPFRRDETALLRAIDVLAASRAARQGEHERYASRRRREKRAGQRSPRPNDIDPPRRAYWYGMPRSAALHALRHWRAPLRGQPSQLDELLTTSDQVAQDLEKCVTACIQADGELTHEQREVLAACTVALTRRTSQVSYREDSRGYYRAWNLLKVAKFVETASDPSLDHTT